MESRLTAQLYTQRDCAHKRASRGAPRLVHANAILQSQKDVCGQTADSWPNFLFFSCSETARMAELGADMRRWLGLPRQSCSAKKYLAYMGTETVALNSSTHRKACMRSKRTFRGEYRRAGGFTVAGSG